MTITVSRSTILENRKAKRNDPAWVLTGADGSTARVAYADFGCFRLIQRPHDEQGGICYIETTAKPKPESVSRLPKSVVN